MEELSDSLEHVRTQQQVDFELFNYKYLFLCHNKTKGIEIDTPVAMGTGHGL